MPAAETGTTLHAGDLAFFVDSSSWSLETGRTTAGHEHPLAPGAHLLPETLLHFVAYVPSIERQPMRIAPTDAASGGSPSQAFLVRDWGGVVILNRLTRDSHNASSAGAHGGVPNTSLAYFHGVAMQQLRALLGLPDANASAWPLSQHVQVESPGALVVTLWELDALMRRRYLQLVQEASDAAQTLIGLVRHKRSR